MLFASEPGYNIMHSRAIVVAIGLLAAPLSFLDTPKAATPVWLAADPVESSVNGHRLESAPVPTVGPPGISPVDRVAGAGSRTLDAGPVNSTPFSATPSGTLSSGGDQESVRDRVQSPADTSGVTPNLGR